MATGLAAETAEQGRGELDRLWQRGRDFLGVDIAILGGAMTWVSDRNLVSAMSNAGGFGVVACGGMEPQMLRDEINAVRELTDKPFGVNLITMHPQLDELVDVCVDLSVGHVVLAGGVPPRTAITRLVEGGAKVICFTPTLALGKRLIKMGANALVIEGMEAGGHIGPVSTMVLAQEILLNLPDVPIFVAGGIGRGETVLSYLEMGAAGVQVGTRLVCATECTAHPDFKKAFIRASARDAVTTVQVDPNFPVIPVRALANQASKDFSNVQRTVIARFEAGELTQTEAQLEIEQFWAGALRRAVIDGDVEGGSVMAGQSVGMVSSEQPVAEILQELIAQAVAGLAGKYQASG